MISKVTSSFLASCLVLSSAACSSSLPVPPPDCSADPFACPAGQTCWLTDTAGNYACQTSGSGAAGAACANSPSMPSCADGLDCFQTSPTVGFCVAYCDPANPAHGCPSGATCATSQVVGTSRSIHLCVPPQVTDAGAENG